MCENLRFGKTLLTFINDTKRLIKRDKILNRAEQQNSRQRLQAQGAKGAKGQTVCS